MSKEDNIWEIRKFTFLVIGWGFIYLFIYFVNQGAGHFHRLPQLRQTQYTEVVFI